ncbi:MAG: dTDP-glucose 4,6-dehydratase [Myxococcales bacterium]|nr:dTDP-glucose 4,6-dehydratase [Myxococcales bacterium]MCB9671860.1 dTDP-glucose 4,6-dehydratase [Alphaproteobacteria bacterium]
MRLLVTGGYGFIGSTFVHRAVARGHAVVTLDARTYAADPTSLADLPPEADHAVVHADIRDRDVLDDLFASHAFDAVVHLAAATHVDRSIDGPGAFVDTNVTGTLALLEAARTWWEAARRPPFRFLHVSTDEVYGPLATGRATETTRFAPTNPYAASKAGAEHLVAAWHATYGLPTLITRGSNTLGPRQFPEKLVPRTVISALEGVPVPIYGDGGQIRDWLYVDDHADGLLAALERGRPGEAYNLGAGSERTNLQVVAALCDALDAARPEGAPHARWITHVADRPGHDRRYALDAGHTRETLGWTASTGFDDAIHRTVTWILDHEAWWRSVLRRHALGERLGL